MMKFNIGHNISKPWVYILSTIAIVFWGLSYIWSGALLSMGIPVEYMVFVRILIAALVLLAVNLLIGQNIKIKKKDLPSFLKLALLEPFVYFVAETYGIRFTGSPTISSLMIASSPIFSIIVAMCVFKEKITRLNIIGSLICIAGIGMVTLTAGNVGSAFWLGMLLLLIAVLSEVGHASLTKVLSSGYSPSVIAMYQFLFGSVYLLPLFLTKGLSGFDASVYFSWEVIKPLLCLAILCSSLAFSLWANTIKHLGVGKSSVFLSTIPVCTAIAGWVLGHEYLTTLQWLGIVTASLGVVLSQIVIRKPLLPKFKFHSGRRREGGNVGKNPMIDSRVTV